MKPDAKKRLISNIVGSLGNTPKHIQEETDWALPEGGPGLWARGR
jgi:hypothetical protein